MSDLDKKLEEYLEKELFRFQDESFKPFNDYGKGYIDKKTCIQRMVQARNKSNDSIRLYINNSYRSIEVSGIEDE